MSVCADPTSKQRIVHLLDDLPPESLDMVEEFVRFLREQVKQSQPAATAADGKPQLFRYPTVSLPLGHLRGLVGLLPPVGGNALAETEALYDIEPRD